MRLIRKKFEAWLAGKPAAEIVGRAGDTCGCPLANFYHDASGGTEVSIFLSTDGGFKIDRGYSTTTLPIWARNFVFVVDSEDLKVTAGRALEILRRLPQ